MSKSKPESCIFVHDPPEAIRSKMMASYCPPKQEEGNPVLEHAKYVIFAERNSLKIPRPSKYGGPLTFESYESLREAYLQGEIHPLDLKNGVAGTIIDILKPVREHFQKNPEPLEIIKKIETTR